MSLTDTDSLTGVMFIPLELVYVTEQCSHVIIMTFYHSAA